MDTNPSSFMASMLIGTIGFGIFIYGKKQQRLPQLLAGVTLMGYPYFVENVTAMLAIGAGVIAALWFAVRYGA
jgi:hypothetical protein